MSPSDCTRGDEVDAALDTRLAPDHCREVLAHARRCVHCRARIDARTARVERLRLLPDGAPDDLAARRLRTKLVASALRPEPARRGSRTLLAVAAGAILACTIALRPWASRPLPVEPGEIRLGYAGALRAAPDARWRVRDEGGDTRVTLDDGTIRLRVNRRRGAERFRVLLRDAEVEVRGTRFEVVAQGGRLRAVRVDEGLVAVRRRGDAEQLLAAGSRYVAPAEVTEVTAPQTILRTPPLASPPPVTPARPALTPAPAPRRAPEAGRDFLEGALAHARGDHGTAALRLARFLTASAPSDARREDARYLRVLALRSAGRHTEAAAEAARYLAEFPQGLRRAEVTRLTTSGATR